MAKADERNRFNLEKKNFNSLSSFFFTKQNRKRVEGGITNFRLRARIYDRRIYPKIFSTEDECQRPR